MANHLFDLIRSSARDDSAPFLRTPEGRAISYGDLLAFSGQAANELGRQGVGPGDRVVARLEKVPAALILYLACVRAGAVFVPVNPDYTQAEVDYFVADAEPRLFVPDLRVIAGQAHRQQSGFADVARGSHDLAAILYTSGTTGKSKGAMLTHGNLASNALALREAWHWTLGDVLIHALPVFHTHGLFVATNVTLMAGASMIFLPKFDADEIFRALPDATTMMGVPTFYTRLLTDPRLTREATRHMRLFVSGSAPLLADTHREWRERTNHAILERYGMTETNMITSNPYDGERAPGSVGPPLPGVSVRLADVAHGVGTIEVKGPNVFAGYWRQPEKAAELFRDGWFVTGDLGRIDERGYVYIVGRAKDLIITGGFNVYPKEIEDAIDALPGVAESAVIGVAHADFGEGVTAIVVPKNDAALTETHILASLKTRLANYKLPKRIVFVADLSRNTMGKVQKNLLRERYAKLYG